MAGKPQSLSEGQEKAVRFILRKQVAVWTLTGLALLGGITGLSLWQIKERVERKMETLVAKQFEEPRIRTTVQEVARSQATVLMLKEIEPEVATFKEGIAQRLRDLDALVQKTQLLDEQSKEHAKAVGDIVATLQKTLQDSQDMRDKIVGLQSDIVRMQKCTARVQYYIVKGRNSLPNPYGKEMVGALNELLSIALPNPLERTKFIESLGGSDL
jgi:hypothetical protein